jgi:hypothetical protein
MGQNRHKKSSSSDEACGSFLSRHRADARGALQQSPILQNDMDNVLEMNYNSKSKVGCVAYYAANRYDRLHS